MGARKNALRPIEGWGGFWQPIFGLEAVCQRYVMTEQK